MCAPAFHCTAMIVHKRRVIGLTRRDVLERDVVLARDAVHRRIQRAPSCCPALHLHGAVVVVMDEVAVREAGDALLAEAEHRAVDDGRCLRDRDLAGLLGRLDVSRRAQEARRRRALPRHHVHLPERRIVRTARHRVDDVVLAGGAVGHRPDRGELVPRLQLDRPEVEVMDRLCPGRTRGRRLLRPSAPPPRPRRRPRAPPPPRGRPSPARLSHVFPPIWVSFPPVGNGGRLRESFVLLTSL